MERYVIDTNTVSDYFSASLPENGLGFMDSVFDAIPVISIITQIELLCWNTNELIEQNVKAFIGDSLVLEITPDVVTHCVLLRRAKKIKTPDAIIAATALAYGYTLISNNEKDFAGIVGLKLLNPMKM